MNEFYFPSKSFNYQEYLLEQQIYNDIYQYKAEDNITAKMLSNIILNENFNLFKEVLKNQQFNKEQIIYLLNIITQENDNYFLFAKELLKKIFLTKTETTLLVQKCLVSNSYKILELITNNKHNTEIDYHTLLEAILKNPSVELLIFLVKEYDKTTILTQQLLEEIIKNDYLNLFKYYIENVTCEKNKVLNMAIKSNAYEIIDYLLNNIESYEVVEEENFYNDYFDFLVSEDFDKITLFLKKCKTVLKLGNHNLEKLLWSFQENIKMQNLLFEYHLYSIKIKDQELNKKVEKIILEKKLQENLLLKNSKKEIKKI